MTQGERLRELRKSLNLTLEKFGENLGVKRNAISQIETGRNGLSDQMLKSICREYGVREEWLRDGIGEPFGAQTINQELLAWLNKIMPEDDDAFKKRFAYALSQMPDDGWNLIEQFCNNLMGTKKDD